MIRFYCEKSNIYPLRLKILLLLFVLGISYIYRNRTKYLKEMFNKLWLSFAFQTLILSRQFKIICIEERILQSSVCNKLTQSFGNLLRCIHQDDTFTIEIIRLDFSYKFFLLLINGNNNKSVLNVTVFKLSLSVEF